MAHSYVRMDTGFPGVLVKLDHGAKKSFSVLHVADDPRLVPPAYQYCLVRDNVDLVKTITQVGLTFPEGNGNPAPNCPLGSLTSSSIPRATRVRRTQFGYSYNLAHIVQWFAASDVLARWTWVLT